MTATGWKCPECGTVYAPHVDSCECSRLMTYPMRPAPNPPTLPIETWPPQPPWVTTWVSVAADTTQGMLINAGEH